MISFYGLFFWEISRSGENHFPFPAPYLRQVPLFGLPGYLRFPYSVHGCILENTNLARWAIWRASSSTVIIVLQSRISDIWLW